MGTEDVKLSEIRQKKTRTTWPRFHVESVTVSLIEPEGEVGVARGWRGRGGVTAVGGHSASFVQDEHVLGAHLQQCEWS